MQKIFYKYEKKNLMIHKILQIKNCEYFRIKVIFLYSRSIFVIAVKVTVTNVTNTKTSALNNTN